MKQKQEERVQKKGGQERQKETQKEPEKQG